MIDDIVTERQPAFDGNVLSPGDAAEMVYLELVDYQPYVRRGGFVSVHAANNAFGNWQEYNEIIGLGGWGGRDEKSGPYVRFKDGAIVKQTTPGAGGGHGAKHEFLVG